MSLVPYWDLSYKLLFYSLALDLKTINIYKNNNGYYGMILCICEQYNIITEVKSIWCAQ